MKKIIFVLLLFFCSIAYAGEPYVKTYNKGQNWTVMEVGMKGEFKQCFLRSSPFYLDNAKSPNPKYGTTFLEISYPTNNVTFSGKNIGVYFKTSKQTTLQVDDGVSIAIIPETPTPGKSIVENFMKGNTARIAVSFGGGPPDIYTFSLSGFSAAYKMLPACSGISRSKQKVVAAPSGVSGATITLDSFLKGAFAKQYGISKQDGWALKNGLFNNELPVSYLQRAMLSASTKEGNMLEAGVMFLGTVSLDDSEMTFVIKLLKTLNPITSKLHIKESITKSLLNRVSQIKQAPIQNFGKLHFRAANVGGDAVIDIELQ